MSKWLLLTAGLGSKDFEDSAKRVAEQAYGFGIFDKVVALDTESVLRVCHRVARRFPSQFSADTRGFGHMVWKSELVTAAFDGEFGSFDHVLWVDGGCELNPNIFTRYRLKYILFMAEVFGVYAFTLNTPEWKYTKADLLIRFGFKDSVEAKTDQFQTTWFCLSGDIGRKIAFDWLNVTLENYGFSDVDSSQVGEVEGFVENRYDQSIFSLVCKKENIKPMKYIPVAGTSGIRSEIRAVFHPIWTTRNRTGDTKVPRWILKLQFSRGRHVKN
jgi:hypothetical protein